MTRPEFKVLFTALGFLAVVMKDGNAEKDGARQAKAMAGLIEAYCREAHPDFFHDEAEDGDLQRSNG